MRQFKAIFLGVILALSSGLAFADAARFDWTAPGSRINGDPLPISEIESYSIECGTVTGGPYTFVTYSVPETGGGGVARTFTSPDDFTPGAYFCRVGAVTENPDDPLGPPLPPAVWAPEITFTVEACTAATCGATAPGNFSASVI